MTDEVLPSTWHKKENKLAIYEGVLVEDDYVNQTIEVSNIIKEMSNAYDEQNQNDDDEDE